MCMCCDRGQYGVRKMLSIVEEQEAAGTPPKITMFGRKDSSYERVARLVDGGTSGWAWVGVSATGELSRSGG